MKNKVAIMTWHSYDNYGSVLQAFALRKMIINMGYNTDLINYEPRIRRENLLRKLNYNIIKNKILSFNNIIIENIKEKKIKFDSFRTENFTYTSKCDTKTDLYSLNNEYNRFICGSDQIWAPTVFDDNYFLSFVNSNDKKIAYAPSIGLNLIEDEIIKVKMKNLIQSFSSLSIREERGKEIIKELCNKEAEVVLDPTLLLTKIEWNDLFKLNQFDKKEYILIYCLGDSSKAYSIAKRLAKNREEIILIPGSYNDLLKKNIYNASPIEFLKLIYNAKLVITDSYHGTIFSINYNVPFITLKRFKDNKLSQNSRIYNILKMVNAENRLYKNNLKYFINNMNMDFKEINKKVEEKRKVSKAFLISSLSKMNKEQEVNKRNITEFCAGCGICVTACPQKCINLKLNQYGFYEYYIDKNRCIDCGICRKVCAQVNNEKENLENMKLYSAYSNDNEVLKNSSSGGLAYEIGKIGIEKVYEIIGCTYDYEKQKAQHIRVNTVEELKKFSGSKYIQSNMKDVFNNINKIEKGIIIGTPCQIASVHNYLKMINKRDNFLLVDLICHGVPSYLLWNKFLKSYPKVKDIEFRYKRYGWRKKTFLINKKDILKENKNAFYDFFNIENIYNKSCYECNYRTSTCADIRLGDYWGPKFANNNTGVSMVVACTMAGRTFIEELNLKDRIIIKEEPIEDYFKIQQSKNIAMPLNYEKILEDLSNDNYTLKELSNKYCKAEKRYRKLWRIVSEIYHKFRGD